MLRWAAVALLGLPAASAVLACEGDVTVAFFAASGRLCLSHEPALERTASRRCVDTRKWNDGTNGCKAYADAESKGDKWCLDYGTTAYSMGAAVKNCCACGGGTLTGFDEGERVEVSFMSKWRYAWIQTVWPNSDFSYEVRLEDEQGDRKDQSIWIRDEAFVRAPARRRDAIDLTRCAPTLAQRWRLTPVGDAYHVKHAATGARLGFGFADAFPARIGTTQYGYEVPNALRDVVFIRHAFNETPTNLVRDAVFDRRWRNVVTLSHGGSKQVLVGGRFSKPFFAKAEWAQADDPDVANMPVQMWELSCAPSAPRDAAESTRSGALSRIRAILGLARGGGAVSTIAAWDVLGVDRSAGQKDVKAAFRELSRLLHPDKRAALLKETSSDATFDTDTVLLDAVFNAAQTAYDGLKASNERDREIFRVQSETDERLFGHLSSAGDVFELEPKYFVNGSGAFALNVTGSNDTIWIVMLYSTRCSMSRAVSPLFELASSIFKGERDGRIHFGAFSCGGYGAAKVEVERVGFSASFGDAVCRALEADLHEMPRFVAVVENIALVSVAATLSALADDGTAPLAEMHDDDPPPPPDEAEASSCGSPPPGAAPADAPELAAPDDGPRLSEEPRPAKSLPELTPRKKAPVRGASGVVYGGNGVAGSSALGS
ncbi:hypothetical protein M885DRAFT_114045 [Pelagophyceae sp. CCMP2097]|nr:hypothetical protein M885DRAFT_114045 [Pelagophyceae sp. CCMP2097]